jgi:hypothetical protein
MQMVVLLLAYLGAWQRMADRQWMYTSWTREKQSNEWVRGTNTFLDQAFGPAARGSIRMRCSCSKCKNKKWRERRIVMQYLFKNGYVRNYTRWVHHGEPDVIR